MIDCLYCYRHDELLMEIVVCVKTINEVLRMSLSATFCETTSICHYTPLNSCTFLRIVKNRSVSVIFTWESAERETAKRWVFTVRSFRLMANCRVGQRNFVHVPFAVNFCFS